MHRFPDFMCCEVNRIATAEQATPGVEGYVFDGADGSQMAFWTCHQTAASAAHAHDYDEYMVVVEGCYTLIINGERIALSAGEEYFIPRGLRHGARLCQVPGPSTRLAATGPTASQGPNIRQTVDTLRHSPSRYPSSPLSRVTAITAAGPPSPYIPTLSAPLEVERSSAP